jgi:hypothetical protein
MDDNTQTSVTDNQAVSDQTVSAVPVGPAAAVPTTPVVEEPGIEEQVQPHVKTEEESEEGESFEDLDAKPDTDTQAI